MLCRVQQLGSSSSSSSLSATSLTMETNQRDDQNNNNTNTSNGNNHKLELSEEQVIERSPGDSQCINAVYHQKEFESSNFLKCPGQLIVATPMTRDSVSLSSSIQSPSPSSGNTSATCRRQQSPEVGMTSNEQSQLIYNRREQLKFKDFSTEIRAAMDVEQFAFQAELLLDLVAESPQKVIEAMLLKVTANESNGSKLGIANEIFVPGSSMLMAQTIQEAASSDSILDSETDQSWLCALCTSAQINRRHMVIARFRRPLDMGPSARSVRLLTLVLTPTKEKGTKGALETGRTFATMLVDYRFRSKLLAAPSENEFKTLMMIRAHQLSKKGGLMLKNRHKYMFDAILHMSITELAKSATATGTSTGHELPNVGFKVHSAMGKLCPRDSSGAADQDDLSNGRTSTGEPSMASPGSVMFTKNPNTGKLFELISPSSSVSSFRSNWNSNHKSIYDSHGENQFHVNLDAKTRELDMKETQKEKQVKSDNSRCANVCKYLQFGKGLYEDFTRRLRFYPSDFVDAFVGPPRTVQKTVATIWFLYFGILLPTIAFSSLNTTQTHGHMGDLRKAIIGQAIGGLGFALLGGQPLVIIMTTAPLCLYTKVIHQMCIDYEFPFRSMYAAVGFWNGFFLIIYSLFGFSKLMKWCTRSTEEIFALFIVIAFITDASKDLKKNFQKFYHSPACESISQNLTFVEARTSLEDLPGDDAPICRRETSLLFLLLMLGTLWLSITLYRFNKTQYLSTAKRQLLADYALPTAVIIMSYLGSFVFGEIYVEKFPPVAEIHFERAQMELLPLTGVLTSIGLGFTLSLLFFMDQNISAAMVSAPQNNLKKGSAYHYDLLVVGVLNGFLTAFGLPMMHGVLPHSPLHVRNLADIEEVHEDGHLREVIKNCRENRVTAIVAHILLLASLLLIPYPIAYIPRAVLNGLFLYMAVSSLDGLQVFERITLLFTEQSKYPPNHYIRRCPQRKIHKFTFLQLAQLGVMCLFGFSPFNIVEMFFPVIILLMIPFRHRIVPKHIDPQYLEALDGKH